MWLLKKLKDGTVKYFISEKETYTVGRKNCDIVLEDASVSRKHCTFFVTKDNESTTKVWIVDEQSKYGTFLKSDNVWVQINANERKNLISGSVIKFGLLENIWRLEWKPIIACASGVPADQKKNVENTLQSINGFLKNSWCKECSLVVVNEITLTVKVVLALINGIPIVTPNYVEMVAEAVRNQSELPNYENYCPVIKESILDKSLVSLDVKKHRRELFKGKKFIIPTKRQLETLKDVIVCAGGSVELLSSSHAWERLAGDDVVVIQLPFNNNGIPEALTKMFKEISSFLKTNHGKRIVPESEIAQAVAYSSVDKFCNPKSTCFNLRIGERKQLDLAPVIVEDTPTAIEEGKNPSQHGVVFASATFSSETPFHRNYVAQSQANEHVKRQPLSADSPEKAGSSLQQGSQKPLSQRKRTHKSEEVELKTRSKKARKSENCERSHRTKGSPAEDDDVQNNTEVTSNEAEAKERRRTDNLRKLSQEKVVRENSGGFWESEVTNKRKNSESEDSNRKKAKILEKTKSKEKAVKNPARRDAEIVRQPDKMSESRLPPRKIHDFEEENDFADYFGKDTSDGNVVIEDLSNTILSLTIIPPSFLKADGSLIDPPDVPVNVKRFKKQKMFTPPILNPLEDEELSDGEWIEPHSDRLNISVFDGDEY